MFLRDDDKDIIFTGHKLEIYIPESYVTSGNAYIKGSLYYTFGILPCRVFDKNDKIIGEYTLNLPVNISLYFSDYEIKKLFKETVVEAAIDGVEENFTAGIEKVLQIYFQEGFLFRQIVLFDLALFQFQYYYQM